MHFSKYVIFGKSWGWGFFFHLLVTTVHLQGKNLDETWMMFLIWVLTGSQCNHFSPTQEADLGHLRPSTEVEQTEVCP